MRSFIIIICLQFYCSSLSAQISPSCTSLVEAERKFVQYAKEFGLRQGFLKNLSPDAVLLEQGKEVNGISSWEKKPKTDMGYVYWDPVFVDVGASGDFGYTTGPLAFYKSGTDTVPAGRGYFTSIWQKDLNHEWKLIFDLGSSASETTSPALYSSAIKGIAAGPHENLQVHLNRIVGADSSYNYALLLNRRSMDASFFSQEGRLYRSRNKPLVGIQEIKSFADAPGRSFRFAQLGAKIASSGELAYSYGRITVTIEDGKGGKTDIVAGYLRIWKNEKSGGWKIVLDTIG